METEWSPRARKFHPRSLYKKQSYIEGSANKLGLTGHDHVRPSVDVRLYRLD